ncbi:MAG: hypothetical protein RSG55_02765, partial [Oscillospiraceae bacterium]
KNSFARQKDDWTGDEGRFAPRGRGVGRGDEGRFAPKGRGDGRWTEDEGGLGGLFFAGFA